MLQSACRGPKLLLSSRPSVTAGLICLSGVGISKSAGARVESWAVGSGAWQERTQKLGGTLCSGAPLSYPPGRQTSALWHTPELHIDGCKRCMRAVSRCELCWGLQRKVPTGGQGRAATVLPGACAARSSLPPLTLRGSQLAGQPPAPLPVMARPKARAVVMPQLALVARLSVRARMSDKMSVEERLVRSPSSNPLRGRCGRAGLRFT